MPAVYPLYSETIKAAIVALNKRNGSSSQAIEEYIKVRSYKVGEVGPHLKNLLPLESLYTPRLVRKAPSRCPSRKRRRNIRRTVTCCKEKASRLKLKKPFSGRQLQEGSEDTCRKEGCKKNVSSEKGGSQENLQLRSRQQGIEGCTSKKLTVNTPVKKVRG